MHAERAELTGSIMLTRRNRKGRPAKSTAKRDRKGRARGEPVDLITAVVLAQPHRCSLPVALQGDQKAEHPLGQLQLRNQITEAQYQAGRRYARVVAQYRAVLDAKDPIRQRVVGNGGMIDPEDARGRANAYNEAFEAIGVQKWQWAVARVCVAEEPIPSYRLDDLRYGLDGLVKLWGLTAGANR